MTLPATCRFAFLIVVCSPQYLRAQSSPLTPETPAARLTSAVALDSDSGRVTMFGGQISAWLDDHLWQFDGSRWHLRAWIGPGPQPTSGLMAFDEARHRQVLFGSYDTWEWDGAAWSRTPNNPTYGYYGRALAGMVYDGSTVLMITEVAGQYAGWRWNGAQWNLVVPGGPPATSRPPSVGFDRARGKLVLFGGAISIPSAAAIQALNTMWTWDGTTWAMVTPPTLPPPRYQAALGWDPSRGILVLHGGYDSASGNALAHPPILRDTYEWNGATWTQAAVGPKRSAHSLVWVPAIGSLATFGGNSEEVDAWDGSQWRTLVTQGFIGVNTVDAGSRVLSIQVSTGFLENSGGVSEWTGRKWRVLDPALPPGGAFAFDSARGVVVSFGGATGLDIGAQTWEWTQPGGWIQRLPPVSPPPRHLPGLGYDPVRQRVVMFGGYAVSGNQVVHLSDTWEYDGTGWTQLAPVTSPMGRWRPSMGFDPVTQGMVLCGGQYGVPNGSPPNGSPFGDAWELLNGNWTTLPNAPLTGGVVPLDRLTFDQARNRLVLYRTSGDVAVFTGIAWQSLGLMMIQQQGFAFDPITGDLLTFGYEHSPAARFAAATPASVTAFGQGCSATTSPRLGAELPWLGNPQMLVDAVDVGAGAPAVIGLSTDSASIPIGGCTLLLGGAPLLLGASGNAAGIAAWSFPVPMAAGLRGFTVYMQAGALQTGGVALTGGLSFVVGD